MLLKNDNSPQLMTWQIQTLSLEGLYGAQLNSSVIHKSKALEPDSDSQQSWSS